MKLYRVRLYTETVVVVLAERPSMARRAARDLMGRKWATTDARQVWALSDVPVKLRDAVLPDGTTPRERLK